MSARRARWIGLLLCIAALWPGEAAPHNPVTTTILFNREIATLFEQKCLQCHADGKLAMPLVTFDQARPWAQAIKEEALARHMPPWPAERGFGTFANDASLTNREMGFLLSWIDGGAPAGVEPGPAHMDHSAHWMLGDPDLTVTAATGMVVAAGAPIGFRRMLLDPGLTRDAWVRGFDYKAGDGRVARAAFISIEGTQQFLGGWTPWSPTMEFAPGTAMRLPAGARLAVDVLYQPGIEQATDRPTIGLYFADRQARSINTLSLTQSSPRLSLADEADLLSMRVQMATPNVSLEVRAKRPDGTFVPLLRIRNFRQEWQTPFVFARPVRLPRGTTLQAIAHARGRGAAKAGDYVVSINSAAGRLP